MPLEAIMTALHRVIDKPAHEHLRRWHDAQELTMIADLHHIVGRRRGGTTESVGRALESFDQGTPGFAHIAFEDTALIKHHADKVVRIKVAEHLVVGDVESRMHISLRPTHLYRSSQFCTLGDRLACYSDR